MLNIVIVSIRIVVIPPHLPILKRPEEDTVPSEGTVLVSSDVQVIE